MLAVWPRRVTLPCGPAVWPHVIGCVTAIKSEAEGCLVRENVQGPRENDLTVRSRVPALLRVLSAVLNNGHLAAAPHLLGSNTHGDATPRWHHLTLDFHPKEEVWGHLLRCHRDLPGLGAAACALGRSGLGPEASRWAISRLQRQGRPFPVWQEF